VLSIVLAFFFTPLAAQNRIRLRRAATVLFVSVAVPVAVSSYAFATTWRTVYGAYGPQTIDSLKTEVQPLGNTFDVRNSLILPQVFGRVSFLGMATELIAHAKEYRQIVNPAFYVESIIDTGLTPGFDVFGVVRVMEALHTVYAPDTTMEDARIHYHSDQLTAFAEYYLLFGYAGGLLALFFSALAFKLLYLSVHFREVDVDTVAKALILSLFYNFWLNSFGLDYLLIGGSRLIFSAIVFISFVRLGRKRLETATQAALAPA